METTRSVVPRFSAKFSPKKSKITTTDVRVNMLEGWGEAKSAVPEGDMS
jgi:hypothetical protein